MFQFFAPIVLSILLAAFSDRRGVAYAIFACSIVISIYMATSVHIETSEAMAQLVVVCVFVIISPLTSIFLLSRTHTIQKQPLLLILLGPLSFLPWLFITICAFFLI